MRCCRASGRSGNPRRGWARRCFEGEAVWSQQRCSGLDVMGKRGSLLPNRQMVRPIVCFLFTRTRKIRQTLLFCLLYNSGQVLPQLALAAVERATFLGVRTGLA
jgi:hypothetical protein